MTLSPSAPIPIVVLDTNVISELMRAVPEVHVKAWVRNVPPELVYTTSVSVAEVRSGIARLPPGRRRDLLTDAADDVFSAFSERVLPFDLLAASAYAEVVVGREQAGAPIAGFDAQIAAICKVHRAALATRNTNDFLNLGLELIDPWPTAD